MCDAIAAGVLRSIVRGVLAKFVRSGRTSTRGRLARFG
jgi:hypothetical protein